MLGKAKKTLPPGVGEESSGCSALEGLLKKKNSSGQWKERYGLMNNNFFLTYKPKGNAPSSELKESVDLKKMQSVAPIGADNFVIIMQDGERLEFQGVKRDEWLDVIRERADWAVGKTTTSSSIAMPSFPSLEGTIKKKNSHGQFKDRYCVVSATKFVGYMLKGSQRTDETKENFDLRDLVNVSLQGDCFEMELKNGETMVFKAAKPRDWVDGIQMRVDYLAQMMPGPPVDSSPAIGNLERRVSNASSTGESSSMVASLEGIIKKKNSYGQFKERFCAVTDSYFLGYKLSSKGQKTDDVKEKVDLRDICEVSVQGDCFEIELKNGEKMTFKASKPQDWVDSILAKLNVLQKDLGLDKLNITDDVANMEGLIKKKNSAGQWKDRYALFKNHTLFTFKPKGNAPSKEQKEAILLKDIDSTRILTSESFEIELMSGEKLVFQTPKAREWASTISAKANVASEIYKQSLASFNIHGLHLSGWLMKKSHNKYQGYQERFVKLEGNTFKYFKKDSDPEVLGSACMNTVEFVRPYDDTPDCQVFELKDEDRVFIFQAASKKEMLHWVSTIDRIKSACQTKKQEEVKAKLEAETPIRIRWFDEKGVAEFTDIIRTDLADCYPDPSTMEEITLRKHLEFASELVGYMTDFVPEIQRCESRPARYDILALMMTEVNNLLQERFSSFLQVEENDRSEYIEMANLGDLHALIDWLTRYQVTLRGIRCPVYSGDNAANASTAAAVLSVSHLNPKQCSAFDAVPNLCRLYVFGGSTGAKGGAAAHLYDHCIKVWENVISNPEEMLQRHNDGTFFTHTPIDMWEAINQHVSLARSTHNPILHVMIAEKVVSSLNAVFDKIIDYIKTLDTNQNTEMKEIELEFFSALANDTAIHIEEVIQLIDSFSVEEIRQRIDDIFDPLTTNLVNCGQACLKRLAGLVMSDVQTLLDEVFMPDWMEGKQMRVATATISDYMRDFEEYLVEFWAKKFQYTILEEVVISYTRSVLFAKNKGMTQASSTAVSNNQQGNQGFMSSIFQKTKQITQTIITFVPSHVPVDEESLGRLAQDVNILNAFFSQKAGQELATEFLVIINEVSLLLFLDMTGLLAHFDKCVTEFPSAAPAVKEVVTAVMRLRYDVFSKSDIEDFLQEIQPALERSIEVAKGMEKEGVPEGKLGLLYSDVVPKDVLNSPQKITLAQRMKLMSNISFGVGNKSGKEEEDEEDFDGEQVTRNRAASVEESTKTNQLLDEVMEVLQQKEEENDMLIKEQEEAEREEELQRRKALVLSYDGYLEKKSPAHNLWQRRYFKFSTRETFNPEKPYAYNFMWYKKEGGAVIKALEIDKVQSLAIIQSPRALVYVPNPVRSLMLQAEAKNDPTAVPVTPMDHEESNAKQQAGMENYVFAIIQTDGKEHILRSGKLDRVIKWINTFAMASGMAYDTKMRQWNRSISMYYDQLAQERAQLQTFQNVSTTPLPQNSGRQRSTSIASTEITSSNTNNDHIDSESAAALIQSAKALTLSDPIPLPNSNSSDQTVDELEALAEKEEILRQEKETLRQELEAIETVETSRAEHNEVEEIKEMHIESDDRISVSTNPILKKSMNSTDNPLLAVKQSKPEDQAHFHETPDPVASVNESKPTPKKSVIKRRIKASRRASNGLDESDRMSETASVSSEYLEIDEDEMAAEIESSAIRMSQPSIPPPPPPSVPISASASAPVPSTLSLSPPPPPPPVSSPPPPQTTIQPSPSSKKERLSDSDINPLHAEALLTAARNDQPLRNEIKPVAIDSSKLSAKVVESSPEDRDSVMTVDLDDEDESSKSAKSSSSMKSNRSKKDRQTNRVSFAETVKDEHNKVPPGFHRSQVASLELEDNDRQHLIAKEKSGCGCCIIA